MIEKLYEIDIERFPIGEPGTQILTMLAHINGTKRKVNELVDAVNELQNRIDPPSVYQVMKDKDAIIGKHIGKKTTVARRTRPHKGTTGNCKRYIKTRRLVF